MAMAHNCLIRGLNAILLQAPNVPEFGTPGYKRKDVADLLFYIDSWIQGVKMHHDSEENFGFPAIERETGHKGLFDHAEEQHHAFTPGMEKALTYVSTTKPEDFRWNNGLKEHFDSFTEPMTKHLYEEIDLFMGFDYLNSEGLRKGFQAAEDGALGKSGVLNLMIR